MAETYIFEANTTNAAIEKGLRELKVSKDKVEIKILEEDKKSFFSILSPRVVKVEMTLKEDIKVKKSPSKEFVINENDVEKQKEVLQSFLNEFISKLPTSKVEYKINLKDKFLYVEFNGEDVSYLIGHRGETLNALQNILNVISSKQVKNGARILVDIENYRAKREETLNILADKLSKTVMRTRKPIKLEPMSAFERKIIHSRLQENDRINTYSVGKEPYRRLIIELK